ncbi:MAG: transglutaminase domain-containing protein [Candidatus Aenigmarchaeota archaeon]|nr:transglutaminase domain-containing protein [Candidatus Aenigmarchaeota archaeon]
MLSYATRVTDPDGELAEPDSIIDIDLEAGKWYDIPVPDDHNADTNLLTMPIVQDKNILIEIGYKGSLEFREEVRGFPEFPVSYPQKNPILTKANLVSNDNSTYSFVSRYVESEDVSLPTTAFVLANTQKEKIPEIVKGSEEIAKKIRPERSFGNFLVNLYSFVLDCFDRDEDESTWNMSEYMPHLVKEYFERGNVSGDCKSISTFFVGLSSALGLVSRRVTGKVVGDKPIGTYGDDKTKLTSTVIGHTWPEIYVPLNSKSGFWVPVDPSGGVFMTYPTQDVLYHLFLEMPRFKGQKVAQLRVSHIQK